MLGAVDARREAAGEGGAGRVDDNEIESRRGFGLGLESRLDNRLGFGKWFERLLGVVGLAYESCDVWVWSMFVGESNIGGEDSSAPVGVVKGDGSSDLDVSVGDKKARPLRGVGVTGDNGPRGSFSASNFCRSFSLALSRSSTAAVPRPEGPGLSAPSPLLARLPFGAGFTANSWAPGMGGGRNDEEGDGKGDEEGGVST